VTDDVEGTLGYTTAGKTERESVETTPLSVRSTVVTWPAATVTEIVAVESGVPVPSVLAKVETVTRLVPAGTPPSTTHVRPEALCEQLGFDVLSATTVLRLELTIATEPVAEEM
jgi:hypothetical protein